MTCEQAQHLSPVHPVAFDFAFRWFHFPGLLVLFGLFFAIFADPSERYKFTF